MAVVAMPVQECAEALRDACPWLSEPQPAGAPNAWVMRGQWASMDVEIGVVATEDRMDPEAPPDWCWTLSRRMPPDPLPPPPDTMEEEGVKKNDTTIIMADVPALVGLARQPTLVSCASGTNTVRPLLDYLAVLCAAFVEDEALVEDDGDADWLPLDRLDSAPNATALWVMEQLGVAVPATNADGMDVSD
jgi:hypothetical protein